MAEKEQHHQKRFTRQMVKDWYSNFTINSTAGAAAGMFIAEAAQINISGSFLALGAGAGAGVYSVVTYLRENRNLNNEMNRRSASDATRSFIAEQMDKLFWNRTATIGAGFITSLATVAPGFELKTVAVAGGVALALEAEERMSRIGSTVVYSLEKDDPPKEFHFAK